MILDTNAVSALFAGDHALKSVLDGVGRLSLPVIVVGEYRYGLTRSRLRPQLEPLLETLIAGSMLLAVDLETTRHYAQVRDALRNAGNPIPENDVWISALARQHNLPIVSRDRHFDAVDSVQTLSW